MASRSTNTEPYLSARVVDLAPPEITGLVLLQCFLVSLWLMFLSSSCLCLIIILPILSDDRKPCHAALACCGDAAVTSQAEWCIGWSVAGYRYSFHWNTGGNKRFNTIDKGGICNIDIIFCCDTWPVLFTYSCSQHSDVLLSYIRNGNDVSNFMTCSNRKCRWWCPGG